MVTLCQQNTNKQNIFKRSWSKCIELPPSTLYPHPQKKKKKKGERLQACTLYWGKSSVLRIQLTGTKQFKQNSLLLC